MQTPENHLTTFTTKNNQVATLRYPTLDDVAELTRFINTFSLEDSFTRFSGEQMTLAEEESYLVSELESIAAGNTVKLFCFVNEKMAGVCDVHRDESLLTRKQHTGILGLIIAKEFRGEGIGEQLIRATISESKKRISRLQLIKLDCFATNSPALSLYQKVGFQEVGRIPKALFYKNGYDDEVLMFLELE